VFFESARRVADTLGDLAAVLGARDAVIARELTKHFETVRRGLLPELASVVAAEAPPKGEIVVLVGPPGAAPPLDQEEVDNKLGKALEGLSVKDAAAVVSAETGQPRRKVYARAVELAARAR
jgi:16S rRNA (cytidine1402-2'-O)-methyltransferase